MTGLGSIAQKWQHRYKNWLWKTINRSGNFKKSINFNGSYPPPCRETAGGRWHKTCTINAQTYVNLAAPLLN
jgi:hypothetical protein